MIQPLTIAACLIARNGAETLPRLIESVRPHVDEVCIFLAGESTDGTPEILERLAAEPGAPIIVRQGSWTGSYADARNAADAMARSEYIAWFDDDEVLEGGEHLRPMLATRPDVLFALRVDVWERDKVLRMIRPRVIRADLGARWVSPIHEHHDPTVMASAAAGFRVAHPQLVRVIHAPIKAPGRHRHRELVEATFARTGERRLALYVAQHLAGDDLDDAAAATVLESIVAEPWPSEDRVYVMQGFRSLADCLLRLGDAKGAEAAFAEFDALNRERLRDPFMATMQELLDAHPIASDDPLWARYADDPRTADPRADARRDVTATDRCAVAGRPYA